MTKTAQKAPSAAARMKALEDNQAEMGSRLDTLIDVVSTVAEKVDAIAAVPAGTAAKDAPVVTSQYTESEEQFIGGPGDASIIEVNGEQQIEQSLHANVDDPAFKEKIENIKFSEQIVEVDIHTTTDKDSAKQFPIMMNGKQFIFERGKRFRVPRYVVEGLARAKPVGYGSEDYMDTQGLRQVRYPSERGVRYPFALVNPSAVDNAWLQSVLAQP